MNAARQCQQGAKWLILRQNHRHASAIRSLASRGKFNLRVDRRASFWHRGAMSDRLDEVFSALADPTRRAILSLLLEDDMAVTDVAHPFDISLAAVSKHLAVLARAGLILQERRGRLHWCKLNPDGLREICVWMQGFGQFEPLDLDAFERFLAVELARPDASRRGATPPPGQTSV
jgi:DNA-binding transcriptional ArsR family regulator